MVSTVLYNISNVRIDFYFSLPLCLVLAFISCHCSLIKWHCLLIDILTVSYRIGAAFFCLKTATNTIDYTVSWMNVLASMQYKNQNVGNILGNQMNLNSNFKLGDKIEINELVYLDVAVAVVVAFSVVFDFFYHSLIVLIHANCANELPRAVCV